MIHIRKGIKKISKSGFYRVRIRIPGPESGKFETNFFLKCIVANIFPETKFALKRFLLQAAFINQAPSLGLNYAYLMVLDGSTFSSKILRGVDWSFLFLNFRCICLLSIFRVSETAQCVSYAQDLQGQGDCVLRFSFQKCSKKAKISIK